MPYKPLKGTSPALAALKPLLGTWRVKLFNAEFIPSDAPAPMGEMTVEWFDEAFVLMRFAMEDPTEVPPSVQMIGRNEDREDYEVLYYDRRGVSRILTMTFDGTNWTMERDDPGFAQRFSGSMSKDRKTINGYWERCHDGKSWIHDFDLTYTKVG